MCLKACLHSQVVRHLESCLTNLWLLSLLVYILCTWHYDDSNRFERAMHLLVFCLFWGSASWMLTAWCWARPHIPTCSWVWELGSEPGNEWAWSTCGASLVHVALVDFGLVFPNPLLRWMCVLHPHDLHKHSLEDPIIWKYRTVCLL